ncbi:unnamed protein product [Closterium sp. NIES-54]
MDRRVAAFIPFLWQAMAQKSSQAMAQKSSQAMARVKTEKGHSDEGVRGKGEGAGVGDVAKRLSDYSVIAAAGAVFTDASGAAGDTVAAAAEAAGGAAAAAATANAAGAGAAPGAAAAAGSGGGSQESSPILLPKQVSAAVLQLVVEYCRYHSVPGRSDKVSLWEWE